MEVSLEPAPTATVRTIRVEPPPGLARGSQDQPAWLIATIAASLVTLTAAYFLVRWWRSRR